MATSEGIYLVIKSSTTAIYISESEISKIQTNRLIGDTVSFSGKDGNCRMGVWVSWA